SLEGVDQTVLQQRADFLRPDSLVAVIMLTDEDDSFADPLSFLGRGWKFAYRSPLWRPTSACATDPASPDCMSCADTRAAFGSTCQSNPLYTTSEDDPNVRFFHMKQRFGVDPQFPVQRYISGFTNSRVPDRNGEHVIGSDGVPGPYLGTATCTNPLFAAKLPSGTPGEDTCNLPLGARTADRVFFAVIGGVPNSLLPVDPTSSPTADDWVKILGADPANFNYDGISPYMIQSTTPRAGVPAPTGSETFGNNGNDPVVGRDYITNGTDLQYACTFDLPPTTPNPCADVNSLSCDCASTFFSPPVIPPLCSAQGVQTKAKAYPTIRPFQVVKALGNQGIIASLCPIQLTDNTRLDYGYNPAVASIVNRLKNALTQQCLPQQFTRDPQTNEVPCFVLAQLSEGETCDKYGLAPPSQDILSAFIEQQNAAGFDVSQAAVCQVPQSAVPAGDSCKDDTNINWCYVENTSTATPASNCAQALLFSAGSRDMAGARFVLQCTQ
ncbi:MAG: hypothetical protein FWD69_11850, partial [Polyangiaceae bacterium]|nr:hypothetical protein [Polyangiaceae bacterium]